MSELLIKNKDIVVPGEELAVGMDFLPSYGTYRQGDKIIANKLGLVHIDGKVVKLISLSGRYNPKRGDTIIGEVTDLAISGWRIDINSAYSSMLSIKDATSEYIARGSDLTQYFNIGDRVVAKIINVTTQKLVDLTMRGPGLRKLKGGRMVYVNTNKVPRIIGKSGSMVTMIKKATDCMIIVGQNGVIWVQGEPEMEICAVNTIKMIEKESHISGLTDMIQNYLEKTTGRKIELPSQ